MRRGRKRKEGSRKPCGRLMQTQSAAITPEAIDQRARIVGNDNAMQPEAGYALGQLLLLGVVSKIEHDAGMAFRQAWNRWRMMSDCPSRFPKTLKIGLEAMGGQRNDVTADQWARARLAYLSAVASIPRGLSAALVESLVLEDVALDRLRILDKTEIGARLVAGLKSGLGGLAKHYGMR